MNIVITINEDKLLELIAKHTVETYVIGLKMFPSKVINARTLLEELHRVAECDKEVFIDYVNCLSKPDYPSKEKYQRHKHIDDLFNNIEWPDVFLIRGFENLKGDPFIRYKNINLDERLTWRQNERILRGQNKNSVTS